MIQKTNNIIMKINLNQLINPLTHQLIHQPTALVRRCHLRGGDTRGQLVDVGTLGEDQGTLPRPGDVLGAVMVVYRPAA